MQLHEKSRCFSARGSTIKHLISSENDWNEQQQGNLCSHTVVPQLAARPESNMITNATLDSSVGNDEGWREMYREDMAKKERHDWGSPE